MTNNNSFVRRLCLLLVVVCTSLMASAQTAVKGNVTDEKGEPIIGASIQIKGEQGGAVTDLNGNYKINNVGNNAVLRMWAIVPRTFPWAAVPPST